MNLTAELKKWIIDHCDVKADATDDEFKKTAGEALATGKLTTDKFAELTTEKSEDPANEFQKQMASMADGIGNLVKLLTPKEETEDEKKVKADKAEAEAKEKAEKEAKEKADKEAKEKELKTKSQPSTMAKMIARFGGTPEDMGDKDITVRVKEVAEQYDSTTKAMTYPTHTKSGRGHPLAGRPVMDFGERGRVIDEPSDLNKAVSGAFAKFLCATARRGGSKTFGFQALPQHDKELLLYAMENMKWSGASDGGDYADIVSRKLFDDEKQALIDDATSGGFEAAPIVFDHQVIQVPLLHGELFPLINTIPLDRGRRVEGVATGTVTGSWGGVDDTAITLFNTASYVSAFDTTIYRWEGAIRIGLDFLSDTPIDFGAHITAQYGERLLEDLDDVVATGNGTTQPEGVINKAGATAVVWGAATSIGNYESLRFSIPKNEHRPNVAASAVFCGTETSYQRAMAIPVGAADARRLAYTNELPNYDGYSWMKRPYKINESLTNAQIFYAILARYRMYRRRGLTMRTSTEGDTLIRRNELLMVAMCRYGGQLERGAVAGIVTDAPA